MVILVHDLYLLFSVHKEDDTQGSYCWSQSLRKEMLGQKTSSDPVASLLSSEDPYTPHREPQKPPASGSVAVLDRAVSDDFPS